MAFMLYSIDEAIDGVYVVTKSLNGQAKVGTLIHVMDARENSDGIIVDYRVTRTGQNFVVKFETVKEFCKWVRPDKFIARHYDNLTKKEIRQYIKVTDRTFTTYCLPIIIVLVALIWIASFVLFKGVLRIVLAVLLSVIAFFGVVLLLNKQKENIKLKLYSKLNIGVSFK